MDIYTAKALYEAGDFEYAVVEPDPEDSSCWLLEFRDQHGTLSPLTGNCGAHRHFHSEESAMHMAETIGFNSDKVHHNR